MKKIAIFKGVQVLGVALALTIAGCYTQLGYVRDETEQSDEYQATEGEYYNPPADSNARVTNNYFFGRYYPSSYFRFGFNYYYPSYYWGWYNDPFYWNYYDPFFYDPWICGTPFVTYGYPWYYGHFGYGYPYYGGGYYYHPRGYYVGGETFRGSRNFGSTRGSTRGVRGGGSTRGLGYTPPPAIPVSTTGTPVLTGSSGRRGSSPTVNTNTGRARTQGSGRTEATQGRGSRGSERRGEGHSSGRDTGSRRSGGERTRRQEIFPPFYRPPVNPPQPSGTGNEGTGRSRDEGRQERSGGRDTYTPPAPHSAPSYSPPPSGRSNDGGGRVSSGGGSSGGGARSGGSSGGSSGGGGRSGGSTRGSR